MRLLYSQRCLRLRTVFRSKPRNAAWLKYFSTQCHATQPVCKSVVATASRKGSGLVMERKESSQSRVLPHRPGINDKRWKPIRKFGYMHEVAVVRSHQDVQIQFVSSSSTHSSSSPVTSSSSLGSSSNINSKRNNSSCGLSICCDRLASIGSSTSVVALSLLSRLGARLIMRIAFVGKMRPFPPSSLR